jgi:hypothetical protein
LPTKHIYQFITGMQKMWPTEGCSYISYLTWNTTQTQNNCPIKYINSFIIKHCNINFFCHKWTKFPSAPLLSQAFRATDVAANLIAQHNQKLGQIVSFYRCWDSYDHQSAYVLCSSVTELQEKNIYPDCNNLQCNCLYKLFWSVSLLNRNNNENFV